MSLRRIKVCRAVVVAATAVLCTLSLAPSGAFAQQQDEAPTRVGRVADVGGQLFFAPEDRATEWAPIELNYPVTSGDNLWLSGEGRAEIDFGVGQLRIAGNTNVHVSRLDDHDVSLFVAQGRAIIALRSLEQGDVARIDTPNTQVELTRPGVYRIDVADDRQETTLVVREGEANVALSGGIQQVLPGQTAQVTGTTDVRADVRNGGGLDGFDTWSASRDRYYVRARSTRYVSNQMVGYADLDENGTWEAYPEYGNVWFPTTVAVDWVPYRYGHWVSVPVWGWTWVDSAPWGYAPFHYGRWAYIHGRWGWCPGEYVRRPAWAPALVAWYGGSGWGVSVSGGGPVYGWVPLGWREPYAPWWRNCGSRCWSQYNRPYAVNPTDRGRAPTTYTYVNYRVPNAITAVPGAAFAGGKPVAPNVVHIPPTAVASAPVLGHTPPPVKPVPVTANMVRPGNGVPPPASTIPAPYTKPMLVSPERGRAITSVPPGRAASVVPPSEPVTAAPPGRAAPAVVKPAPAATPPGPAAVNNAPPARVAPQVAQEAPPGRGQSMRREAAPPVGSTQVPPQAPAQAAVPQAAQKPAPQVERRGPPQGIPMPRPAPQGAPQGAPAVVPQPHPAPTPVPQPHAAPVPQPAGQPQGNAPRAEHGQGQGQGQGRGPEKPGHPQPAQN